MTHSHGNQTTRRWWQQSVLSLPIALWIIVASPEPLHSQDSSSPPTGSKIDPEEWKRWHEHRNEGWAAYNIAREYHQAYRTSDNPGTAKIAFEYYKQSANSGNARAQANLGFCYDKGIGVEENQIDAKRWYEEAAQQGNVIGQLNFAQKLLNEGIEQKDRGSIEKARKWFQKAYDQDPTLTEAAYGIGLTYVSLPGATEQDFGKARNSLLKAKEQPKALFAIGWLDEKQGRYGSAIALYKQAKKLNSLPAAYNLARCYELGLGVAKNNHIAMEEYRFAAERGHAMSQFAIGLLKYNLSNQSEDYMDTVMWWRLAERNQSDEAREALQKILRSQLLTQDEIAIAEQNASALENKIQATSNSKKPAEFAYDRLDSAKHEKPTHKVSGFFITDDGWLLTSPEHLKFDESKTDPDIKELVAGHSIKVVTHAGIFPASSKIIIDKDRRFAVIKLEGKFKSLPLASSLPESSQGNNDRMNAVTIDSQSGNTYAPAFLEGQFEIIDDPKQADLFTLNTSKFDEERHSNFLSYDPLGQATGLALKRDIKSNEKLIFLKSSTIRTFLKSAIKEIQFKSDQKNTLTTSELNDLVSLATATVLIYKN